MAPIFEKDWSSQVKRLATSDIEQTKPQQTGTMKVMTRASTSDPVTNESLAEALNKQLGPYKPGYSR